MKEKLSKEIEELENVMFASMKYLMLVLYNNNNMTNVSNICAKFRLTYSNMNRKLNYLGQLGFVDVKKDGRKGVYTITQKGRNYCKKLLEDMQ